MKPLTQQMRGRPGRQAGLTLVELIIAMVIGLTVVGAGLAMYVSSGFSSRGGSALSQMTEDASIALSLLRSQVAMAGYSKATGSNADGIIKEYNGDVIFGCTGGATSRVTDALSAMTCSGDDDLPDSLVVLYQADISNTVPDSSNQPTDCLGNPVPVVSGLRIAENRYYLSGTTLNCKGNGHTIPQPLVENVVEMKISYGVAGTRLAGTTEVTDNVATKYATAKQISGTEGLAAARWKQVTSARICIVIRSDTPVLDEPTPYTGCTRSVTPTDKYLYRAFTTTVVLQNRIL